jgi:outer membrane protein OmpA-like peptidoglycan-associated protein
MPASHALVWCSFCLALTLVPGVAGAQELRLHGVAGLGHAIGGYQQRELSWGGTTRGALELVFLREFGVYAQGSGTWLGAGELPKNSTLAPVDAASSYELLLGAHVRPFARHPRGRWFSPAGLWLGGAGGYAWTGGARRYAVDSGLGLDFLFSQAQLGIGPMIGWEHVFQPNSELRPEDANVLFAGVHVMFEIGLKPWEIDGDRDGDGIRDSLDKCPTVPEDKDGFEDEDGCPDKDNDNDGIVDVLDKCPNVAEDKDGFEDEDGCPDMDNDKDGILDAVDRCPNEAEDKDGFEDEDGCPDMDNDKDGIPDKNDLCPNEPETFNGYADEDGCPDAEQIRVVGDKIVLDDRVHFMVNSHIIQGVSWPLLDRLARLISQHPEYIHIEVEGHTDERGPDWFNDKLSQDRADSVLEFLVSRGIKRSRLSARGFGKSKPLVERNTEYAWYMNRRVEFEITREKKESTLTSSPPAIMHSAAAPLPPKSDDEDSESRAPATHENPPESEGAQ